MSKICGTCHGTGHDKGGKPVVEQVKYTDDQGKERRRYVTKSQGSGCITCHGVGKVS